MKSYEIRVLDRIFEWIIIQNCIIDGLFFRLIKQSCIMKMCASFFISKKIEIKKSNSSNKVYWLNLVNDIRLNSGKLNKLTMLLFKFIRLFWFNLNWWNINHYLGNIFDLIQLWIIIRSKIQTTYNRVFYYTRSFNSRPLPWPNHLRYQTLRSFFQTHRYFCLQFKKRLKSASIKDFHLELKERWIKYDCG